MRLSSGVRAVGLVLVPLLVWLLRRAPARKASGMRLSRLYRFHGREIFPGIGTPISRTTRYGATFVGVERGGHRVTLIGWVNYTPIFFKPDTESSVVGGRWWIVATGRLRYLGSLHGTFGRGKVRWNGDAKIAAASIEMKSSAGNPGVVATLAAGLNHLPFPPLPPVIGAVVEPVSPATGPQPRGEWGA